MTTVPFVRVKLGAGDSCEVRKEFTIPGECYCERISKHVYSEVKQRPERKVWLCVAHGVVE